MTPEVITVTVYVWIIDGNGFNIEFKRVNQFQGGKCLRYQNTCHSISAGGEADQSLMKGYTFRKNLER